MPPGYKGQMVSMGPCRKTLVDLSTTATAVVPVTVCSQPCQVLGIYVSTVMSAHAADIKDGTNVVATIAASSAAGTEKDFKGMQMDTSLVITPASTSSTGKVLVLWNNL